MTRDRRSRQVLGFLPVPCPVSSPQWGPGTGRALRGSCYHEWPESRDVLAGRRRWGPARSRACCGYRHPRSAAGTPRLGLGGSPTSAPLRLPCVWLLPQVKPVGPPDPRPRVCWSSSTATSGPGPGGCLPLGQITDGGWRPGRRSTRTGSAGHSAPPGCPGGSGACVGALTRCLPSSPGLFHLPVPLSPELRGTSAPLRHHEAWVSFLKRHRARDSAALWAGVRESDPE